MTAIQGSPRFTGFIRRLVDEGVISAEDMQGALSSAKKDKIDIVPYLIEHRQPKSQKRFLLNSVNRYLTSVLMILP